MSSKNWPTIAPLLLLCQCAAVVPTHPEVSADSWIKLGDGPSSGPVCNRPALEVIALRRVADRMTVPLALSREAERADIAEAHARAAEKYASSADWWQRYGPIVAVFFGTVGIITGAVGGLFVGRSVR